MMILKADQMEINKIKSLTVEREQSVAAIKPAGRAIKKAAYKASCLAQRLRPMNKL